MTMLMDRIINYPAGRDVKCYSRNVKMKRICSVFLLLSVEKRSDETLIGVWA